MSWWRILLTLKKLESEKNTEEYLRETIESLGGICWKWECPYVRGVMDRICFLPGIVFFVEVKSEGKDLSGAQERRARDLTALGQRCHMADTKARVDEIIKWEIKNDQATSEGTN